MLMSNKKLIVIVSVIVLLLGIGGYIIWATMFAPPSKQDYIEANAKAEKIKTYSGLTLLREFHAKTVEQARNGLTGQELTKSVAAEKKKTVDAVNARAELMEELSDSPVLRDSEVKKKYDIYQAREVRYANYIKSYADVFPAYRSSFATCVDIFEVAKKAADEKELAKLHAEAAKDCKQDLAVVAKTSITPLAEYGKEFNRIIVERQKVVDGMSKGSISVSEASKKIDELSKDFSLNNPTEEVNKYGDDAVFNGELDALAEALKKKTQE